MVIHPADYPWSSYRANAHGDANSLITPHPIYQALGTDELQRQAAYRELFRYQLEQGLVDEIRASTNGGFVLGGERFQKEIAAVLGRRTWRGSAGRHAAAKDGAELSQGD